MKKDVCKYTETDFSMKRFTLVELLTVMVVAAILAAIALAAAKVVSQKSKRAAVKSTLEQIQLALEQYEEDWGYYPQTGGEGKTITRSFVYGTQNAAGLQQPRKSPGSYGEAWGHYYLNPQDLKYKSIRSRLWIETGTSFPQKIHRTTTFCVDKWDKPYWYQCPGEMNKKSYDLWSTGADQMHGDAEISEDGPADNNNGKTYPVFAEHGWLRSKEKADPGDHATTDQNDDITNWRRD